MIEIAIALYVITACAGLVVVGYCISDNASAQEVALLIFLAIAWPITIPVDVGIRLRKLKEGCSNG